MKVAAAVEAELKPKMVEAELVLGAEAMVVVEPDAVAAAPMVVVAGILVEPVEPKAVVFGISAGVVVPMVVDAETVFVMAVPMGLEVAAALVDPGVDPKLVAFAADWADHENVSRVAELVTETVFALEAEPRVAEHLFGFVLALEADSRMAGFEGSKYLLGLEAVLGSE